MHRVHHLDCGTLRPPLVPTMVAHCLLVEREAGLLLVDTGFGTGDVATPRRLGRPFVSGFRPDLDQAQTALAQVRALGHDPRDVTDIVVTHLDLDHAGGLGDFPHARVHVHADELEAATRPGWRDRARYVPAQWAHQPRWVRHRAGGDAWRGLTSVTVLGDDVLMVPLPGHSRGHTAVAVRRPDAAGWLLHAGDAYFHADELATPPACPLTLRTFQRLVAHDDRARRANAERLRELHAGHGSDVRIFSAHDPSEYAALAGGASTAR